MDASPAPSPGAGRIAASVDPMLQELQAHILERNSLICVLGFTQEMKIQICKQLYMRSRDDDATELSEQQYFDYARFQTDEKMWDMLKTQGICCIRLRTHNPREAPVVAQQQFASPARTPTPASSARTGTATSPVHTQLTSAAAGLLLGPGQEILLSPLKGNDKKNTMALIHAVESVPDQSDVRKVLKIRVVEIRFYNKKEVGRKIFKQKTITLESGYGSGHLENVFTKTQEFHIMCGFDTVQRALRPAKADMILRGYARDQIMRVMEVENLELKKKVEANDYVVTKSSTKERVKAAKDAHRHNGTFTCVQIFYSATRIWR